MDSRHNRYPKLSGVLVLAVIGLLGVTIASAQSNNRVQLLVHPEYSEDTAQLVYEPLIKYLNQETGRRFELVTPRDYRFYWRNLQDAPSEQFALDDPHIAAFRIRKYGYQPVARASDGTQFKMITNLMIEDAAEAVDSTVATLPNPSLGYSLLISLFPNPLSQPLISSEVSSWRDTVQVVFAGDAGVAMVPDWLANQYPNLYPIWESERFPGLSMTAHADVSSELVQSVRNALTTIHEKPDLRGLQVELNIESFVSAQSSDYVGLTELLSHTFSYESLMDGVPPLPVAEPEAGANEASAP